MAAMGRVSRPVVAGGPIATGVAVVGCLAVHLEHTPEPGRRKQPMRTQLITPADYRALGAGEEHTAVRGPGTGWDLHDYRAFLTHLGEAGAILLSANGRSAESHRTRGAGHRREQLRYSFKVLLSLTEVDVAHLRFAIIARYGIGRTPVTL
jgi:hypothetical protein